MMHFTVRIDILLMTHSLLGQLCGTLMTVLPIASCMVGRSRRIIWYSPCTMIHSMSMGWRLQVRDWLTCWGTFINHAYTIGITASSSIISLYCLNLPKDVHYKAKNIFVAGLTPPPNSPDHYGLCHLLDPLIDDLLPFSAFPGVEIPTSSHPEGVRVQARIAPVIADSPARVTMSGFLSHSAIKFCAFCTTEDLAAFDLVHSEMRTGEEVRSQAKEWRAIVTKTARGRRPGWDGHHFIAYHIGIQWSMLC